MDSGYGKVIILGNKESINKQIQKNKNIPSNKEENYENRHEYEKRKRTWLLETWNIRGINGKQKYLEKEVEKTSLDILAITGTK